MYGQRLSRRQSVPSSFTRLAVLPVPYVGLFVLPSTRLCVTGCGKVDVSMHDMDKPTYSHTYDPSSAAVH